MGTDGLVYKREASEQDDSVEDLVNITKGKCLCIICTAYCGSDSYISNIYTF